MKKANMVNQDPPIPYPNNGKPISSKVCEMMWGTELGCWKSVNCCTYLGFNLSLKKSRIVLPAACSALSLSIAVFLAIFQVMVDSRFRLVSVWLMAVVSFVFVFSFLSFSVDEEVVFGSCWYLDDTFTEVTFDIAENRKSLSSSAICSRCLIWAQWKQQVEGGEWSRGSGSPVRFLLCYIPIARTLVSCPYRYWMLVSVFLLARIATENEIIFMIN